MQGRLENKIKREKVIENLLKDMPQYVTEYYYNLSSSRESSSCLEYIRRIRRFLLFLDFDMNKINICNVTDIDISKFLKSIETKEKNGNVEMASFSTWKQYHTVLNSFFKYLCKRGYVDANPVDRIERIRKNDKVQHDFLSANDLKEILKAVDYGAGTRRSMNRQKEWRTRDKAIMLTFITTGMRETALCEIDINRIDFSNRTIVVTDKENKNNSYTMTPELISAYYDWLDDREKKLEGRECDALFISNRRERLTSRSVIDLVRKYTFEGIGKEVSPHRLRAAYGNILLKETGDIYFVSKAMKHANVQTTEIYIEDNERDVNNRVADIMNKLF